MYFTMYLFYIRSNNYINKHQKISFSPPTRMKGSSFSPETFFCLFLPLYPLSLFSPPHSFLQPVGQIRRESIYIHRYKHCFGEKVGSYHIYEYIMCSFPLTVKHTCSPISTYRAPFPCTILAHGLTSSPQMNILFPVFVSDKQCCNTHPVNIFLCTRVTVFVSAVPKRSGRNKQNVHICNNDNMSTCPSKC